MSQQTVADERLIKDVTNLLTEGTFYFSYEYDVKEFSIDMDTLILTINSSLSVIKSPKSRNRKKRDWNSR
jgi:hypothetical protein